MKIILDYWEPNDKPVVTESGFCYRDTKSVIKRQETLEGDEEKIFKAFYDKNNSLRYCNGSYYKFQDKEVEKRYFLWWNSLSDSTRFDMFYGNGIVD